MVREILLLGHPDLYRVCPSVTADDLGALPGWVGDLHDTLMAYRAAHGAGRAIAAPQIGVQRRLIYMNMDRPNDFVNPTLSFPDGETYELMDDCMSFPGLCVRVRRFRRALLTYQDEALRPQPPMLLEGDVSELVQHEYDHLDGILATMRAVDDRSLFMMEMKRDF